MAASANANDNQPVIKSGNKGGAPKKRVKRELIIRIRMTATERFQIATKARAAGMRASSWIRAAAKSAKIVPRLTAEERRILWMLAELANNLNQLTKLAHQLGMLTVISDCSNILGGIDTVIRQLYKDDRESDNR